MLPNMSLDGFNGIEEGEQILDFSQTIFLSSTNDEYGRTCTLGQDNDS